MIKMYPESERAFHSSVAISEYIHGGRGIVKLQAPSGAHHFYMFQKPMEIDAFPDDVIFVYAIHEQKTKFYLGMIEENQFRLTRNSRFLPDTDIVKGAYYIIKMANNQSLVDRTPMVLSHMGMCARCGRQLTAEDVLEGGIGKKCRKILGLQ